MCAKKSASSGEPERIEPDLSVNPSKKLNLILSLDQSQELPGLLEQYRLFRRQWGGELRVFIGLFGIDQALQPVLAEGFSVHYQTFKSLEQEAEKQYQSLQWASSQTGEEPSLYLPSSVSLVELYALDQWKNLLDAPPQEADLYLGSPVKSSGAQLKKAWRHAWYQLNSSLLDTDSLQVKWFSAKALQQLTKLNCQNTDELLYAANQYQFEIQTLASPAAAVAAPSFGQTLLGGLKLSLRRKFQFFFTEPLKKDLRSRQNEAGWFRLLFAVLVLSGLLIMFSVSGDYGITGDEVDQKNYGDHVYAYYETKGEDTRYKTAIPILQYYGGLFDYQATRLTKTFPGADPYDVRHGFNSLFGFLMMFFAGLMARLLSGSWMVGCMGFALAFCSPRLFGDSMNNPKDIPFGAGFIMGIYYLLYLVKHLPKVSFRALFMMIPAMGIAIGVRAGGLLLIPYVLMFVGLAYLLWADLRKDFFSTSFFGKVFKPVGIPVLLAVALGYWAGTWYWPYAQLDVVAHPWRALSIMTNYTVGIRILFSGDMVWSDNIPWNYLPEWLWISTPLVVILGLVLSPLVLWRKYDTAAARRVPLLFGLLIFAGVFPVAYAIYKNSNLYDGMRHFLFIYPVFPVLAAWGWGSLAGRLPAAFGRLGVGLVVMGLLAMPLHWLWRSHPYQYVYFNELSGGLKAAYSEYETDYWMTAMRRCSKWLVENEPKIKKGDTLYVSTNCFHPVKHYFSKYPNVIVRYTNYHDREKNAWDYGLFYPRFLDPKFLASEIWPSKYSVYAEEVDGVKLGAVLKNPYPKHGAEALRLSTTAPEQSVALLEELVKNDPKNESAWMILAQIRLQMNNTAGAKSALDTLVALSDQYVNSLSILGMYYFQINQIDSAKAVFERGTQINYKYPYGYYQLARIAFSKNEFPKAMEYIDLFDKHGGKPEDGYNIGIQLAQKLNDNARLYYFQAKVLFAQNKVSEGYNMLQQAVLANKNYEPAAKLKRDYDQLIEEQRKEQAQQRRQKK